MGDDRLILLKPPNKENVDEMANTAESTQINPIDAIVDAMLTQAEVVNRYATDLSAQVDILRAEDATVNPAYFPLRDFVANLAKSTNGAIMDSPVIPAVEAKAAMLGLKDDFRELVTKISMWSNVLTPAKVDNTIPTDVSAAVTALRQVVDNPIFMVGIPTDAADAVKGILDAYTASRTKMDTWYKATKRSVPSQTGTVGPDGRKVPNGPTSEKSVQVVFVLEDGSDAYSGKSPQPISKAGHAIKEKVAQNRNMIKSDGPMAGTPDVQQLPESDLKAINDTLREMADGLDSVTLPGIGQFTRIG